MANTGDIIKKSAVITDYIAQIQNKVNSYLVIQNNKIPTDTKLNDIKYIFGNVGPAPTVANISNSTIKSEDITLLVNNFLEKYTRGRTLTYITQQGIDTNGGNVTYQTTSTSKYKALMSDTTTQLNAETHSQFINGTTKPPYSTFQLNIDKIATDTGIKPKNIIRVSEYKTFFDKMYEQWKNIVDTHEVTVTYRTCHTNCHSSCHGSRSRR